MKCEFIKKKKKKNPFEASRITSINSSAAKKNTLWVISERKNYSNPGKYLMKTFEIPLHLHWRCLEIPVKNNSCLYFQYFYLALLI